MVIGKSFSGKFSFIRFLYKYCFEKEFIIDDQFKEFREFVYKVDNGRRG